MDSVPYAVSEALDEDFDDIMSYLKSKLPFSVNMAASIRDHRERCRVLVARQGNLIAGVLVEFHSTYSSHIWLDPIIWMTGNSEVSSILLRERGYGRSIIISQADFSSLIPTEIPAIRVFEEFFMSVRLEKFSGKEITPDVNVRRLEISDADDSLKLSGYNVELIDQITREKEENFLKERFCFGLYANGQLASRGAIMSITDDYASVGAFFTLKALRNRGYGSTIVSEVIKQASSKSQSACLLVRSTNDNAISLYSKFGFDVVGKAYFTDLGTGLMP